MAKREIERWVTSNGHHIPIFKLSDEEKALKAKVDEIRKNANDQGKSPYLDSTYDVEFIKNPIPQLDYISQKIFYELFDNNVQNALNKAKEQTLSTNISVFSIQPNLRLFSYNYNMEHESDKPMQLIKISKGYVVVDGNHRMLKASMDNRKTIRAKVYDMSKLL